MLVQLPLDFDWIFRPEAKLGWESLIHILPAFTWQIIKSSIFTIFQCAKISAFFLLLFKLETKQHSAMFWAPSNIILGKNGHIEGNWVGESYPQCTFRIRAGFWRRHLGKYFLNSAEITHFCTLSICEVVC